MNFKQAHCKSSLLVLLLSFLTFSNSIFGQLEEENRKEKAWEEGYVVIEEGDTLFGEVKNHPINNNIKIRNPKNKSQKATFKAKNVLGYYRYGVTYHSKKVKGGWRFAELVSDGKVRLYKTINDYHHTNVNPATGQMGFGGFSSQAAYYIEKDGQIEFVRRSGFKTNLVKFFRDDEKLCKAIQKKELKYKSLERIDDLYNGIEKW